jgi:aspartate/methionine/tyrosine aminotransferase
MKARSSVTPIAVNTTALSETLTEALVPALEAAIMDATCPVKALVFTNPHNPLGQRYPKSVLESCILFCKKHDIHFVSDEVYALTSFTSADCPEPTPFTSALSIDIAKLGFNPARIHVFWSTSKDFGQSGLRLVSSLCVLATTFLMAARYLV